MFTRSPMFIRIQSFGQRFTGDTSGGAWWLMMATGMGFILVALAILLWPELLAYMVASVLLFTGVTLVAWSWRMRGSQQRWYRRMKASERGDW